MMLGKIEMFEDFGTPCKDTEKSSWSQEAHWNEICVGRNYVRQGLSVLLHHSMIAICNICVYWSQKGPQTMLGLVACIFQFSVLLINKFQSNEEDKKCFEEFFINRAFLDWQIYMGG